MMFKKILGTFFTKGFVTVISFGTILLTTHNLGSEGRGDISIISTVVGLMGLVNGFVGGTALVYLMPRSRNRRFYIQAGFFSVLWAFIVCLFGALLYRYGYQTQSEYWKYALCMGVLTCIYSILLIMILSHEDIRRYNLIGVLQATLNFVFFTLAILLGYVTVGTYIYCLCFSYLCTLMMAIVTVRGYFTGLQTNTEAILPFQTLRKMVSLGFIAQMGNFIQYFNYRFSFFIINIYVGTAGVGIYSVGISLSEAAWMLAQSIAVVQYSTIANCRDKKYAIALTGRLAKLSFMITFFIILGLVLLPESVFGFIFGEEFAQIRTVLLYLSPGIVIWGLGIVLSNYFAGHGQYYINTLASFIGLIVTVPGCFLLIPRFGYIGAAITASLSYVMIVIFQLAAFLQKTEIGLKAFKITREDWDVIKSLIDKNWRRFIHNRP